MMIFPKANLALLFVPKTATTSLISALESTAPIFIQDRVQYAHTSFKDMRKRWPHLKTVALMREPLSWVVSWFKYRSSPVWDGNETHTTKDMSFPQFIDNWIGGQSMWGERIDIQSDYLTDGPDKVDHLFAYENMTGFLHFIEQQTGVAIDLPRLNLSPARAADLSPRMERDIRAYAARDFDLYPQAITAPTVREYK